MTPYTKMDAAELQKELESRNLNLIKVLRGDDFTTWNRLKGGLQSKDHETVAVSKVRSSLCTSMKIISTLLI
jgi:hypothetical protein